MWIKYTQLICTWYMHSCMHTWSYLRGPMGACSHFFPHVKIAQANRIHQSQQFNQTNLPCKLQLSFPKISLWFKWYLSSDWTNKKGMIKAYDLIKLYKVHNARVSSRIQFNQCPLEWYNPTVKITLINVIGPQSNQGARVNS